MTTAPSPRRVHAALALLALGGSLLVACQPETAACDATWTGADGGDFGTATNWSTGMVPDSTQRACAPTGSSIVVTTPQTIDSGDFGGTVTIPGGSALTLASQAGSTKAARLAVSGTIGGTGIITAGALDLTGGTVTGSTALFVTGSAPSTITSGRVEASRALFLGDDVSWSGTLDLCDSGAVHVAGNLTLTSPAAVARTGCPGTNDGDLEVDAGASLTVNAELDASAVPVANHGDLTVGATLRAGALTQPEGATTLAGGTVQVGSGAGSFDLAGGTLTGTGTVDGSLQGAGRVEPGTAGAGVLTVSGTYAPTTGGQLGLTLSGTTPGVDYGQLSAGTATLTATALDVTLGSGYTPTAGSSYDVVTATGAVSGPFAGITTPTIPTGAFVATYGPSTAMLQVTNCSPTVFHPGANLAGANYAGADLSSCDLTAVDLTGADLTGANLSGSNLTNTVLAGAQLGGADLTGATLTGANLNTATGLNTTTGLLSTAAQTLGWNGTDFTGTGIDLTGADLAYDTLVGVKLDGANLSGATLDHAVLQNASLTGANVSNAHLTATDLTDADLTGADLSGSQVNQALIGGAVIENTLLTNTDLVDATGLPTVSYLAVFGNTTCPMGVNSDSNGGDCEGAWLDSGGGG